MTKQYGTPGPRAIYPEMCTSPSLGRCGLLANALFPRLVAMADDQGRLAGGANVVLLQCLPRLLELVRPSQVDEALEQLTSAGMLLRYAVHGEPLLQIIGWWRWQQSQRRAYPSRWGPPRGWQDLVYGLGGDPQTVKEAAAATSPRNAAIRGTSLQVATPRASAGASARARAMPSRAVPDPTVPPAPEPPARGGARGGQPTRFADLVPPPPGHERQERPA
jgi:hypothetical protein